MSTRLSFTLNYRAAVPSVLRSLVSLSVFCLFLPGLLSAQFNCPAPWASAQNVYGIVTLDGNGSGSSGDLTETVNQHAVIAGKMVTVVPGSCLWQATPFVGLGQMKSQGFENDTVTAPNT